ncbi:MAG: ATP-binding protein, partial [Spirochaetota bacterium]
VVSGKGGTGKSSIVRALLDCAQTCVIADCDVDASNLHLVLEHSIRDTEPFISGHEYRIDQALCTQCGLCVRRCAYNAIDGFVIDQYACEGCGVCHYFCPSGAVEKSARNCGNLFQAQSEYGPFVYARLNPGEENSGKLVSKVRERGKECGKEYRHELMINDGPPGIGCSVIASLTGASAVLIVTEPTISGLHDYQRVRELAGHFSLPVIVCVNRADINPELTERFRNGCGQDGTVFAGTVDYSGSFDEAQRRKTSVMHTGPETVRSQILSVWSALQQYL